MNNKRNILIALLLLVLLGGSVYYFLFFSKVNYLIPGVPYYGFYNLFFQAADTPNAASIMSILGYWGDERYSNSDLQKYLAQISATATPPTMLSFFQTAGYETYQWNSPQNTGGEIKEIKKFINPKQKIPVIIFQKHFTGGIPDVWPRVVIGIFDDEKKVVVHDHFLGNNYEISYQDFENMFLPNVRAILAVWPSDKIKGIVKGPNSQTSYPPRLEAMDKLGPVLALTWADAVFYSWQSDFKKAGNLLFELVNNQNFNYFPKAFRVAILSRLASDYISAGQLDDAINLIKQRVLPINQNLSEATEGWFVQPIDKFASPYSVLSLAYLKKGEKTLASVSYKEMKLIDASNGEKVNIDIFINQRKIPELEKAISSKK